MKKRGLILLAFIMFPGLGDAEILPSQAAGTFYPASPAELKKTVDSYLAEATTTSVTGEILGGLVPHAGYVYSGKTAAAVYRYFQGKSYPIVIILSAGHRYQIPGAAVYPSGSLKTPLGEVPVAEKEIKELQKLTPLIESLPQAFLGEHAVEVQLPFLQRVLRGRFQIIPLLMNNEDPKIARQIGEVLAGFIKPGKTLIIVSSDLSHFPDKETAKIVDTASLKALTNPERDADYFWITSKLLMARAPKNLVCTYCGEAGVLTALHAINKIGAYGKLLSYTNSGELPIGEPDRVVGYAAVLWTQGKPPKAKSSAPNDKQKKELLKMAREALNKHLTKNEEPKAKLWPDPDFNQPAAVFVTLRRKDLPKQISLRGCIGSLMPDQPLAEAVQNYAIKSATQDPRFRPVGPEELDKINIEISILSPFRKVPSHEHIKPGQGVLLKYGWRSGLFLPQVWEDLPDKNEFLSELCRQKTGLPPECWKDPNVEIQVFDAEKFEE